jgi:hypothetical protein
MRILIAMAVLALAALPASANLLVNGGFEDGVNGQLPPGWTAWDAGWGTTIEKMTRDASNAFIFRPAEMATEGEMCYAHGAWNHGGSGGIYQVITVPGPGSYIYEGDWSGGDWGHATWHETGVFDGAVDGGHINGNSGDVYIKYEQMSWPVEHFVIPFIATGTQVTIYTKIGSQNNAWEP